MAMKKKVEEHEQDVSTVNVSRETLDATPARLLTFLRGVGTRPAILSSLAAMGYSDEEHSRGWDLLHGCSGFASPQQPPAINAKAVAAIVKLDGQDERIDNIIDASLKHRAPQANQALRTGLSPGTGAESVVYFKGLLSRIEALEDGQLEGVPAAQAKVALEVLAKRGLSPAQRKDLAELVSEAESLDDPKDPKAEAADREALDTKLRRARAFFEEWSKIARGEIKRRDHLIYLGLASRRKAGEDDDDAPDVTPVNAEAVAPPAAGPAVTRPSVG